jgi:hypothetical protein
LIAADAGLGSVPLEVRVTRRWREMDSNFQYASTVRRHRATDLPLTPTVKRRCAGRPPLALPDREVAEAHVARMREHSPRNADLIEVEELDTEAASRADSEDARTGPFKGAVRMPPSSQKNF